MNTKKNIALFVASIGFGGTERVVSRFANELVKYYNVTLVVKYKNIDLPIHEDVNIISLTDKVEHFNASKISKISDFISCLFKYQKVLKQHEIDISISFLIRQNVTNSISKMLNPNLKTMISERCFPSKTYGNLGKSLVQYFYNKNDLLFSNSLYINSDLQDNFKLKIPAHLIYNPIYTRDAKPNHFAFNKEKDTFKVISVGRLNPVKNQKSLINSVRLVDEDFILNFYGIGELEKDLKEQVSALNLEDKVHFKGNHDAIDGEILKHHCLILTSLSEGFPNVILESMSLGVPVIATNCMSGPLELLNDNEEVKIDEGSFVKAKYGLLVNVDDEKGLAKAIMHYRDNEGVRKKYSELSFDKAKQYDISTISLQLKELID